jgi:DNA (cytosine-5)-methyltransferase 1
LKTRLLSKGYSSKEADYTVVNADITEAKTFQEFKKKISNTNIYLLAAGIPCQSFSSVGKAKDKHAMKFDKRNWLYLHFIKYLKFSMPKVLVVENVVGILSSKRSGIDIFEDLMKKTQLAGYNIIDDKKRMVLNASNFGIPQERKRVFLIGIRKDLKIDAELIYRKLEKISGSFRKKKKFNVKDAIGDLPKLLPGEGKEEVSFINRNSNDYTKKIRRKNYDKLFNHVVRNHNDDDIQRFKHLSINGWELSDLQQIRPDLIHHDPQHFKNRYTVQQWKNPSKTIISHIHKDGNLFIHPDPKQHRTFTVREAARVQSFPDDFRFCGSRTSQYIQVGNAVPPLLAYEIAKCIKNVVFKKK